MLDAQGFTVDIKFNCFWLIMSNDLDVEDLVPGSRKTTALLEDSPADGEPKLMTFISGGP